MVAKPQSSCKEATDFLQSLPGVQAEFGVTLVVREELTAISNMPQESTSTEGLGDGLIARTFMHTPPMSSYLLAFIVGNITRVSGEVPAYVPAGQAGPSQGPARPVSIWGTPGKWVAAAPLFPLLVLLWTPSGTHLASGLLPPPLFPFLFCCG